MLATAGTGQALTCYNSMYGGPRQPGECDGPEEYHVVLLDNRRTELLADAEQRDALHCIRCGACLNVCPIFRNVGGHTYGTTYSGPIGSVITPHLRGLQDWKHLSFASSLCGACTETCPVKIDLHHHLLQNRRNAASQKPSFVWNGSASNCSAFVFNRPALYAFAKWARTHRPETASAWSKARGSIRRIRGRRRATCRQSRSRRSRNIGGTENDRTRKNSCPHPRGADSPRADARPSRHDSATHSTTASPVTPSPVTARMAAACGSSLRRSAWRCSAANATDLKADFQLVNNRDELAQDTARTARRGRLEERSARTPAN